VHMRLSCIEKGKMTKYMITFRRLGLCSSSGITKFVVYSTNVTVSLLSLRLMARSRDPVVALAGPQHSCVCFAMEVSSCRAGAAVLSQYYCVCTSTFHIDPCTGQHMWVLCCVLSYLPQQHLCSAVLLWSPSTQLHTWPVTVLLCSLVL
jgi:hypothetical protein